MLQIEKDCELSSPYFTAVVPSYLDTYALEDEKSPSDFPPGGGHFWDTPKESDKLKFRRIFKDDIGQALAGNIFKNSIFKWGTVYIAVIIASITFAICMTLLCFAFKIRPHPRETNV